MKPKKIIFILLFYAGIIFPQTATIQSFEHTARWVSVQNFPNYTPIQHFQDTILLVTSEALKRKFNVKEVVFPCEITYKYFGGFGKPKIKTPEKSSNSGDYDITILSFITRDTYNTKVYWNMEIIVQQNGATTFSTKTVHEVEFLTSPNFNADTGQISEEEFTTLFSNLINDLINETRLVPEKITIASKYNIEDSLSISIPNAVKLKMITLGSFLANADFSVSVEKDQKVLTNVVYHDGKNSSKGKGNFGGWLFASAVTTVLGNGSSSNYMKKTHEIRSGTLQFSNGEIHQLKMQWDQNTEKEVFNDVEDDGIVATRTGYSEQLSPMIIDIIKNDSIYGNLTYYSENDLFIVDGKIKNHLIHVLFAPNSNLLRVIENNETVVIIDMQNINPDSPDSFAGNKTSKKIFFPSTKSKLPEWYTVFVDQNVNEENTTNYMEAVFCLFFGIGNHS